VTYICSDLTKNVPRETFWFFYHIYGIILFLVYYQKVFKYIF